MTPARWHHEIDAAEKRNKDYLTTGRKVLAIYSGEKKDEVPFNILFSNTETMAPSLLSAVPRPAVQPRFKGKDNPTISRAARLAKSLLEFQLDPGNDENSSFYEALENVVLDALLPGQGVARICYEASYAQEGEDTIPVWDRTYIDHVQWDRFLHGFARRWEDIPWIGFIEVIDEKEVEAKYPEAAGKISYNTPGEEEEAGRRADEYDSKIKTATIYVIWDKASRTVYHLNKGMKDEFLKEEPDPLEMRGFFPIPRPLKLVRKTHTLVPTAPYVLYENQAKELNRLTTRINKIIEVLKVRGLYDAALKEMKELSEAEDGTFLPISSARSIGTGNQPDLDKAVWMMPIDRIVAVLTQLYQNRESCKMVIHEIMGMADIMRGASKASETLGAQQIKDKWGSLKLKKSQREVHRFARDLMRMLLDASARQLQPQTVRQMVGEGFPLAVELQAQAQPASPGAPRPPQQAPLEVLLSLLADDSARQFALDIETNSTLDPEASEDQEQLGKVMAGISQVLNGIGPLVEQGIMPFDAAKGLLLTVAKRFQFGIEVEDYIREMQAPPPKDEGKDALAQKDLELAGMKIEMELMKKEVELVKREAALLKREAEVNVKAAIGAQQERATNDKMKGASDGLARIDGAVKVQEQAANQTVQLAQLVAGAMEKLQTRTADPGLEEILKALVNIQAKQLEISQMPKELVRGRDGRVSHLVPVAPQPTAA